MISKFTSAAAVAAGLCLLGAPTAQAQTVYGLAAVGSTAPTSLVTFNATAPGTLTSARPITGLGAGLTLVGLDTRPNTGQLFALGYNPTGTQARLYVLDPATGALTAVGTMLTIDLGTTTNRIGFDFNPTVDRIRVTGGNQTNYRLNPNNGALAATDLSLRYNPGNPTATPPVPADANAGQTPGVGSVAYANSFIGATFTVLYDIDEANSRYTTQNPPNDGFLNSRAQLTVNTTTALATDLDIYFNPTTRANTAYLTIATGTAAAPGTQLYTLDFITGAGMTLVGAIGPVGTLVTDIAFAIDRTVPATVTGQLAYALAGTTLLTFDTALPGTIRTSTGVTGLAPGQTLVGLDVRPATNTLYALGFNPMAQDYTLYTLNSLTGALTAVNTAPIALALGTGKIGFDFNPTVDRIRVVSTNRANFRLNPVNGTVVAPDGLLTYAPGDANAARTPSIAAAAYTNSFGGSTATELFDYDQNANVLALQSPPNDGTLVTRGGSGLTVNTAAPNLDLDIFSASAGNNAAYLVATSGTSNNSILYTVNLANGTATAVGPVGNGIAVSNIAMAGPAGVVTATRDRADGAAGVSLYPNPAAGRTRLDFVLPRAGRVELGVFDALGRRVATQAAGYLPAGAHSLGWEARGARAGLYLLRLTVDGQVAATRQLQLSE